MIYKINDNLHKAKFRMLAMGMLILTGVGCCHVSEADNSAVKTETAVTQDVKLSADSSGFVLLSLYRQFSDLPLIHLDRGQA